MSNRRKIKLPKKPKSQDGRKLPSELISLKGRSTAIGNRIKAEIHGAPDPNMHYPKMIVADEGHLLGNDIHFDITYNNKRAVPRAFQGSPKPEK
jgi:hypothetical protein